MHRIRALARTLAVLVSILFVSGSNSGAVSADPPQAPVELQTALYDVATLTSGVAWYIPAGHLGTRYGTESDGLEREEVAEEGVYRYGSAEEVIELVKASVAPRFWAPTPARRGVFIVACGERVLAVNATRAIHEQIAAFLAELDTTASVYVQVVTVPMQSADIDTWRDTKDKSTPPPLAGAIQMGLRVLPSSRSVVSRTSNQALVRGVDIQRIGTHATPLPGIAVGRYGMQTDVTAELVPDGRVRLALTTVVIDTSSPALPQVAVDSPELLLDQRAFWRTELVVDEGTWQLVGVNGGRGLFVRADVQRTPRQPSRILWLARPAEGHDVPLVQRRYSIHDIDTHNGSRAAWFSPLRAPGEAPPAPSELGEPATMFHTESLIELIQAATGPDLWEQGTISGIYQHLIVRTTPAVHAAIASILQTVRTMVHMSVTTDIRFYEVATASVPTDPAALPAFVASQAPTYVACVRTNHGNTNAADSAQRHRYVKTHALALVDGMLGDDIVGTPLIEDLSLGPAVQVSADVSSDGQEALLELRILDQALLNERSVQSAFGPITLPHVHMFKGNAAMRVPMNEATIAYRADHGTTTRIVTVTPRVGH